MAKTVRTDELQLRIVVDGTPARAELANLSQEAIKLRQSQQQLLQQEKDLRAEREKHDKGTAEYKRLTEQISQTRAEYKQMSTALQENNTRQDALRKEIGLTGLSMKEMSTQAKILRGQLRQLVPDTDEYRRVERELLAVETRMKEMGGAAGRAARVWEVMRKEVGLADMSLAQLRQESQRLQAALDRLHPESNAAEFRRVRTELTAVEQRMATLRSGLGPFGRAWEGMKAQVAGTIATIGAVLAGGAIISGIKSWVSASATLSDAQADVQRTTGLTKKEVLELSQAFGQFNTRTPRGELLELARDAGKLGIQGKNDILAFVKAGDQIRVALGEDLGDDAIKNIGKINDVFRVGAETGKDLGEQMLATGSAINAIGQASAADESFLVDFTQRMAGANVQAKISLQNTLGYAGALDQLAQRSETSSTALTQFTLKAFSKTAEYAKVAGMSVQEFRKLLGKDTNEALLRVLEGLKGDNEGLERMVGLFDDIGQEGARAVSVLASLADNTDLVRKQQKLSNDEFAKGTSVTTEFDTKNNTLAANLEILGRRILGVFVNNGVVNGINGIVSALVRWTEVPVSETLEEERIGVQATMLQINDANTSHEKRVALIKELQNQYPDYLGNLDAETVTSEQLTKAIEGLNQALIDKIILQKQDEKIKEQAGEIADKAIAKAERDKVLREAIAATVDAYNVKLKEGITLDEQAAEAKRQLNEQREREADSSTSTDLFNAWTRINRAQNRSIEANIALNEASSIGAQLDKDRTEILNSLNIGFSKATSGAKNYYDALDAASKVPFTRQPYMTDAAVENGASAGDGLSEEEKKSAQAKRKQFQKNQAEILAILEAGREALLQATMSADERELRQLDLKHQEERARVLANEQHTADDLRILDELHANQRANLIEEQGDRRAKAAKEAADKVTKAEQDAQDKAYRDQLSAADQRIQTELLAMDEWVAIYEKAGLDTQNVVKRTEAAIHKIREEFRQRELKAKTAELLELVQAKVQVYQAVGSAIAGVNNLFAASFTALGQANYENTVAAKAMGLAQVAISSGVAVASGIEMVIKANAAKALLDPTAPLQAIAGIATITGAVLSGIANAISLLNSANIPQPGAIGEPPNGAGGSPNIQYGAKGMVLPGRLHSEGGNWVLDGKTGKPVANVERDELMLVLSREATRKNADLIPLMLEYSRKGLRLPIFQDAVRPMDFAGAAQAMRSTVHIDELAAGGTIPLKKSTYVYTGSGGPGMNGSGAGGTDMSETNKLLRALIDRTDDNTKAVTAAVERSRQVVFRPNQEYDRSQKTWQLLKDRNTAKRRRA